jgi:hypothetical protein
MADVDTVLTRLDEAAAVLDGRGPSSSTRPVTEGATRRQANAIDCAP